MEWVLCVEINIQNNDTFEEKLLFFCTRNTAYSNVAIVLIKITFFVFSTSFGLLAINYNEPRFSNAFVLFAVPLTADLGINCYTLWKDKSKGIPLWAFTIILFICYFILSSGACALLLGRNSVLDLISAHPLIFKVLILSNSAIYSIELLLLVVRACILKIQQQRQEKEKQRQEKEK